MISWLIEAWLWTAAMLLAIPVSTLLVQCLAAGVARHRVGSAASYSQRHRAACHVLIPAHNEEEVLAQTLKAVRLAIRDADRISVIADNCDDQTASIASNLGIPVIRRVDATHRGKGYAMQFGIDALHSDPPAVVVFLDADCHVDALSIDRLVEQAERTGRVAQANYRMRRIPQDPDHEVSAKSVISEFAVLVKNWVRPCGMTALGMPTHLTGSGMAFPWEVASRVRFATGNIVEDMAIGCDLMIDGPGPLFCETAVVTAPLPAGDAASLEQRRRWEHGHLHTLTTQVPRMLITGIRQRRPALWVVACDLSIPPLTLLVILLLGTTMAAAAFSTVTAGPLIICLIEIAAMGAALGCAAWRFSDDPHLAAALLAIPRYSFAKVPLYLGYIFVGRERQWVRTSRLGPGEIS